jgi:hypothetical protein
MDFDDLDDEAWYGDDFGEDIYMDECIEGDYLTEFCGDEDDEAICTIKRAATSGTSAVLQSLIRVYNQGPHPPLLHALILDKEFMPVSGMEEFNELLQKVLRSGGAALLDDRDTDRGETPLILATRNRDIGTCRVLLRAHCDVNLADARSGMTALMYACDDFNSFRSQPDIVKLLLEGGADVGVDMRSTSGLTALHYVCRYLARHPSYARIVDQLLDAGADPMLTDSVGNTILIYVCAGAVVRGPDGQEEGSASVDLVLEKVGAFLEMNRVIRERINKRRRL